jgi:hypothetical protein
LRIVEEELLKYGKLQHAIFEYRTSYPLPGFWKQSLVMPNPMLSINPSMQTSIT